jgi:hypothetical protein
MHDLLHQSSLHSNIYCDVEINQRAKTFLKSKYFNLLLFIKNY